MLPNSGRLSPLLALATLSLVVLAIGCATRATAGTRATALGPVAPDDANPPEASPNPSPTQREPSLSETGKVMPTPPGGRASLFSDMIQTHLLTVADTQTVNAVEMTVSDFYLYQGHIFVSICFVTRGVEAWQLGRTTLSFANGQVNWYTSRPTLDQLGATETQPGQHCETLEFDVLPAGANLSGLSLRVESVLLAPAEEFHECETYAARWARSERMKQLAIVADCKSVPGSTQVTIKAKPQGMSEEEAQTIAGQKAVGMILGPWFFTGSRLVVAN